VRTADCSLLRDERGWWLLCSAGSDHGYLYDELHIYHAPRLQGPWRASPANPVRVDAATARPAGPWFRWQGGWARCRGPLRGAVQLLALEHLGLDGVGERSLMALQARDGGAPSCVHTYSRVGSDLAIDWMRWRPRWLPHGRRTTHRAVLDIEADAGEPALSSQRAEALHA
jgi:hypothetical protein